LPASGAYVPPSGIASVHSHEIFYKNMQDPIQKLSFLQPKKEKKMQTVVKISFLFFFNFVEWNILAPSSIAQSLLPF